MKKHASHLVILLPLLANVAALHTLFIFFAYAREPVSDLTGQLIWWGCLSLTYGALALFLRHPRSLRGVIVIALSGFILQLILTLLFAHRHTSFLTWASLLSMWGYMYCRCCMQLLDGTKPESVVATFETTVVTLFVSAFAVTLSVMTIEPLICTAVGVLFALIATARIRSSNVRVDSQVQNQQKGRFLLVGLLVGLGGGVTLLCILLTNTVSEFLTRFTQWGLSVLHAITGAIGRFFHWLVSLLPEQHVDPDLLKEPETPFTSGAAEWGSIDSSLPFYLILAAIAIFTLIALYWLWRNGGFHRISFRSRTVSRIQRKRTSLGNLLLRLWQRFSRQLSFQISYLRLRNTAPGLFVWLERQMHSRHLERQPGETSRAFLTRLQIAFPESTAVLSLLADCLDQHYFGTGQTLSATQIASMRKQLSKDIHSR